MSVLSKIRKATQLPAATHTDKALPTQREIPATEGWQSKRSGGRPRKCFPVSRLEVHPVSQFIDECLIHDESCAEYVGCRGPIKLETKSGATIRAKPTYPRPTLTECYFQFAQTHGYAAIKPKTLIGLVIRNCLERGWAVSPDRSSDARRRIVRGIRLRDQVPFDGEDRGALGPDRRRWVRKSDA